jgi:hypothetical protein
MLGKVKLYLGIEGLKMDLQLPSSFDRKATTIHGSLILTSKSAQKIKKIKIQLIETYERGRGASKRINDYIRGTIEWNETIHLESNKESIIDFQLPITLDFSSIEKIGHRFRVLKKMAELAQWTQQVKSSYQILAEALVEGTALNPSIKKSISLEG